MFYGEMWIFFCDSHEFWHFWHHNFWLYIHEFFKNQLDIYFLVSWDIFGFIITVFYSNGLLLSQGLYVVFQPTVHCPKWNLLYKSVLFYILWKRSRLKSTFLPYHVKKNHSTLEVDTFLKSCCFFLISLRSIINLAHDFKSPLLDIEIIISAL